MTRVTLVDSTLRDGSHAISHAYTPEEVRAVAVALERTGVYAAEVSHGDGLGGSSVNYGFAASPDIERIRAAAQVLKRTKLAVLLLPGIGTKEDLQEASEAGASIARIATHCTEADIAEQHIGLARQLGMETVGFLMLSHMISPAKLLQQAKLMESYGAEVVYVVDSAGAMTMSDARDRVRVLVDGLDTAKVGVHMHNNLGLAVANTLVGIEEGASWADGCLCGLGAGAGNCQLEVLITVLDRLGIETGIDVYATQDAAQDVLRPLLPRVPFIDRTALVLGYAGVYSSFLLHAERAAKRFKVDPRDILLDLGQRRVVGGQEDMIIDVAVKLAQSAKSQQ